MKLDRTAPQLLSLFCLGFAAVLVQVGYWQFVRADELAANNHNPRYWTRVRSTEHGRILDAHGAELAVSAPAARGAAADDDPMPEALRRRSFVRTYPLGDLFAHIVGYSQWRVGETGAERALNAYLTPAPTPLTPRQWFEWLTPPHARGNDVVLTLDARLQRVASEALGERAGAVAVLDVRTGAVLALADYPRFDPNKLGDKPAGEGQPSYWQQLQADDDSPLLGRAFQGLYPPGSTFKVLTMAAALDAGAVTPDSTFECDGEAVLAHTSVKCDVRTGHGHLTLGQTLAKSCNIGLATIALGLGAQRWQATVEATGLTARPELFRPGTVRNFVAAGKMPSGRDLTPQQLAHCGYGQGALAITPLYLASVGQMLGNGGRRLEPWLLAKVVSPSGQTLLSHADEPGTAVVKPESAARVVGFMRQVMQAGGTGAGLASRLDVAGKSGSAQNPHGQAHSWFLVLAPAAAPRVAVAAVVENAGWGRTAAGPVAIRVARAALER